MIIDFIKLRIRETVRSATWNKKTTYFRCLLDLIRPYAGIVRSKGETVQGSEHWKTYTGSYLDEGFLIDYLTVEEYFDFLGKTRRMSKDDVADFIGRMSGFFNDEIMKKTNVTEVCTRIVVLHKGVVVHDLQTNENTLHELKKFFAV